MQDDFWGRPDEEDDEEEEERRRREWEGSRTVSWEDGGSRGMESVAGVGADFPNPGGGPPKSGHAYTAPTEDYSSPAPASSAPGMENSALDAPLPTYALLSCQELVFAEVELELTVGTSPEPMVESDEPLDVPDAPEYTLVVHVVAEGFRLREGESWRNELFVTRERPYPTIVLHLTPLPQDDLIKPRLLRANYSVGGQAIGFAARPVSVLKSKEVAELLLPPRQPLPSTIRVPNAEAAPDLTLTIQRGDGPGDLLWTLASPHAEVEIPDEPRKRDIGGEPDQFARQMVDLVNAREGNSTLSDWFQGLASGHREA